MIFKVTAPVAGGWAKERGGGAGAGALGGPAEPTGGPRLGGGLFGAVTRETELFSLSPELLLLTSPGELLGADPGTGGGGPPTL
jgi:hypothetical protein